VTDITKESVWFIIIYCFFTAGTVKFLQLSFVIFAGEELAEFGFVREECEKNFENHWLRQFKHKLLETQRGFSSRGLQPIFSTRCVGTLRVEQKDAKIPQHFSFLLAQAIAPHFY